MNTVYEGPFWGTSAVEEWRQHNDDADVISVGQIDTMHSADRGINSPVTRFEGELVDDASFGR